jgi:hypothetical protein
VKTIITKFNILLILIPFLISCGGTLSYDKTPPPDIISYSDCMKGYNQFNEWKIRREFCATK